MSSVLFQVNRSGHGMKRTDRYHPHRPPRKYGQRRRQRQRRQDELLQVGLARWLLEYWTQPTDFAWEDFLPMMQVCVPLSLCGVGVRGREFVSVCVCVTNRGGRLGRSIDEQKENSPLSSSLSHPPLPDLPQQPQHHYHHYHSSTSSSPSGTRWWRRCTPPSPTCNAASRT